MYCPFGKRLCDYRGIGILYRLFGKRALDIGLALSGLLIFCFPMLLIGLAILCTMGCPVIFEQERVGRHGQVFCIKKFRTMRPNALTGGTITVADDPRVTPLGRVLRRSKLDELPQLWNVLVGDMSFVGPRPDVPGYADRLSGPERQILDLRPGITGPATLTFRDEEVLLAQAEDPIRYNDDVIFPEKVRLNLQYVRNYNFLRDVGYILLTIVGW